MANPRIRELPPLGFVPSGGLIPIENPADGVTYKLDLSQQIVPTFDNASAWVSNFEYSEDDVVTYGGKIWQSLQNANEGNIPTEGAWWTDITGDVAEVSIQLVNPAAGVVLNFLGGVEQIFKTSSNITAPKNWSLLNNTAARKFTAFFTISGGLHAQTLPAIFYVRSSLGGPDPRMAGAVWTPIEEGYYKMDGVFDGTNWWITINN